MNDTTTESLFNENDLEVLEKKGLSEKEILRQIEFIRQEMTYPEILAPATLEEGIISIAKKEEHEYMNDWQEWIETHHTNVVKFVPASGAASRMFKVLFEFLHGNEQEPTKEEVVKFFENIKNFAFYTDLNEACLRNEWKTVNKLLQLGKYKTILENLLLDKGLNYGSLPKGVIPFHTYNKGRAVSADEHLVEGAYYIKSNDGKVKLHFTVSPEHQARFSAVLEENKRYYEQHYSVQYEISFSTQKPQTDTVALNPDGSLFRQEDGSILFRPGGHGSLIENLNEIDADFIFIKNIDNVVPDHLRATTIIYKKFLGGIMLNIKEQINAYIKEIDEEKTLSRSRLDKIADFLKQNFCISIPNDIKEDSNSFTLFLRTKLNRPIRVCGMVRNTGEAGGGPFIIKESDGTTSLQILESSQVDFADEGQKAIFEQSAYFNPVDIICSTKDTYGNPYDLRDYVNSRMAFIVNKSQGGRQLIAMERPGLWNGGMHNWNTLFVEVPASTFNPVKEVNDLLRYEHQGTIKKERKKI